jgi:hypothetical protein
MYEVLDHDCVYIVVSRLGGDKQKIGLPASLGNSLSRADSLSMLAKIPVTSLFGLHVT